MREVSRVKRIQFQHLPNLAIESETMNTTKFQEQILQNAVQMDASVNFQMNGNMLIVPCPWENDKQVTNGERVNYKAGVSVDADGRTRVKRYRPDGLPALRPRDPQNHRSRESGRYCRTEWHDY